MNVVIGEPSFSDKLDCDVTPGPQLFGRGSRSHFPSLPFPLLLPLAAIFYTLTVIPTLKFRGEGA